MEKKVERVESRENLRRKEKVGKCWKWKKEGMKRDGMMGGTELKQEKRGFESEVKKGQNCWIVRRETYE
jgi:hypothetical protein